MKRILFLAAFFSLISCTNEDANTMKITVVFVSTETELKQYCGNDMIAEPLGCATGGAMSTPRMSACRIYALKDRGFDDHRRLETLGHELKHCFNGPIHT